MPYIDRKSGDGVNRWLARFSISFFVIAVVLAGLAYQALQNNLAGWRVAMDLFAAAAAIALGVAGLREKHKR
jgi:anti-sigma-K factor RskA